MRWRDLIQIPMWSNARLQRNFTPRVDCLLVHRRALEAGSQARAWMLISALHLRTSHRENRMNPATADQLRRGFV